jgi:hypothetical protein
VTLASLVAVNARRAVNAAAPAGIWPTWQVTVVPDPVHAGLSEPRNEPLLTVSTSVRWLTVLPPSFETVICQAAVCPSVTCGMPVEPVPMRGTTDGVTTGSAADAGRASTTKAPSRATASSERRTLRTTKTPPV